MECFLPHWQHIVLDNDCDDHKYLNKNNKTNMNFGHFNPDIHLIKKFERYNKKLNRPCQLDWIKLVWV